jgi:outer membrane murein-binding lipoprotein Lpp
MQLPLPWLLSSVAAIMLTMATMVWSVAGQSNKLDQLITNTSKLEKRVDERDTRVELMKDAQYEARRVQDLLTQRIDNLERASRK